MHRVIDWRHAFWIATGVPGLVLASVGALAAQIGTPSVLVWFLSIVIGVLMSFVFAELSSMFPDVTGGVSAMVEKAWKPMHPALAGFVQWCYWFAWSPVLAVNGLLIGGYVQTLLTGSQRAWVAWALGAAVLVVFWLINHFGVLEGAYTQAVLGVTSLLALFSLGFGPFFTGHFSVENLKPFVPLGATWSNISGWMLFLAAMGVAGWSTYGFETAVSYCSEFKEPQRDAPKAVFASGVLCLVCFSVVPLSLVGALGVEKIREDPSTALAPLAQYLFGRSGAALIVIALIATLALTTNTAMMGSSRLIYQMAVNGYLPAWFAKLNKYKVPDRAMFGDVVVNILLAALGTWITGGTSVPLYIIVASNVGYLICIAMTLFGAVKLRWDEPFMPRPYRCPDALIKLGISLGVVNLVFLAAAVPIWGWKNVGIGVLICLASVPLYYLSQSMLRSKEAVRKTA